MTEAEPDPPAPEGDAAEIRLHGELDAAGVEVFHGAFAAALQTRAPQVVIDLTDVTSVERAGVQALLRATRLHPDVRLRTGARVREAIEHHGVDRDFVYLDG